MEKGRPADLLSHVIPMLSRMDPGLQRGCPAGGINSRATVFGAFDGLPVDEERDGVLCLWHTVVRLACSDACCRARDNTSGDGNVLQDPAADIDVMRREVIAV